MKNWVHIPELNAVFSIDWGVKRVINILEVKDHSIGQLVASAPKLLERVKDTAATLERVMDDECPLDAHTVRDLLLGLMKDNQSLIKEAENV